MNGDQFISSLEQFDKSGNSWNVPLRRDWRIINQVNLMTIGDDEKEDDDHLKKTLLVVFMEMESD